jgi:hypothetical protein
MPAAAAAEFAALQRRWRDFRMAKRSRENGNPVLLKNWTPIGRLGLSRLLEQEQWRP